MAYVIGDDCIACGTCQGECPVEAISEGEKYFYQPRSLHRVWYLCFCLSL